MPSIIARSNTISSNDTIRIVRSIFVAATLSLSGTTTHAEELTCNPACQKLVDEGTALYSAGKAGEAVRRYVDAISADPQSSLPYSWIADVYLEASEKTKPENVEEYRQKAESAARKALSLYPANPVALSVLRNLQDDKRSPSHEPLPAAMERAVAGEHFFAVKKYEEAKQEYEKAIELDPQFARAYVYLGDCYYSMRQLGEAEKYFRKASEIDPLESMAWRYLADTLKSENKTGELREVVLNSIAAVPNEIQNWMRLEIILKDSGISLAKFKLIRKASFNAKTNSLNMNESVLDKPLDEKPDANKPQDFSIWFVYAMWQSGQNKSDTPLSPFETELASWNAAMAVAADSIKDGKFKSNDPALADLYRFYKDGQLKTAIFVLMYREAYRSDFEAWKKANPEAIKHFIDTYRVMPQQA